MSAVVAKEVVEVISASRRTDVPSNLRLLAAFFGELRGGVLKYENPMTRQPVEYPVSPERNAVVSWWSKDYANLIAAWSANQDVMSKYHHHFTFTINGETTGVALEPGLSPTLEARIDQLRQLVRLCADMRQDPNMSIMVHVDPIVVYRLQGDAADRHNVGHVPVLFREMRALGLGRVHFSFLQLSFARTRARLRDNPIGARFPELSKERQAEVFRTCIHPHLGGIKAQTCTAEWLMSEFPEDIVDGACVGWKDIASLTGGATGERHDTAAYKKRGCKCYPHRDVGDKFQQCTNGCRYCFSNPEEYQW